MNFLQHLQQIDQRIEERREKEAQNTLFGMDGDLDIDGALAMSTHVTHTYRMPGGGSTRVTNGKITSTSMPIPGGGRVTTRY